MSIREVRVVSGHLRKLQCLDADIPRLAASGSHRHRPVRRDLPVESAVRLRLRARRAIREHQLADHDPPLRHVHLPAVSLHSDGGKQRLCSALAAHDELRQVEVEMGLFGSGGESLDNSVDFAPGSASLEPQQREKLDTLTLALKQRPLLQLVVSNWMRSLRPSRVPTGCPDPRPLSSW